MAHLSTLLGNTGPMGHLGSLHAHFRTPLGHLSGPLGTPLDHFDLRLIGASYRYLGRVLSIFRASFIDFWGDIY